MISFTFGFFLIFITGASWVVCCFMAFMLIKLDDDLRRARQASYTILPPAPVTQRRKGGPEVF
jgi:hypothetical protein